MKGKKVVSYIIATLISIIWLGTNYYIYFPALNIQSQEFWASVMSHSVIIIFIYVFAGIIGRGSSQGLMAGLKDNFQYFRRGKGRFQLLMLVFVPIACALILFLGNFVGIKLFNAKNYANLLKIEERDFVTDIPESDSVDNIALMDTNSARIFGNRKVGSLSDVVSQFEVDDDYTQINVGNKPMKVADLRYASFFKYLSNKKKGIPGYVMVNPVNSEAEYLKLKEGMKYVPSAYFNHNIYRHVQMHNPTKIIEGCYFEINEEGEPYYICPVLHARIGLFNAMDVKGAVLCDAVTGKMKYYDVKDVPRWVDRVYDGDLLEQKFNWYGELSGGYFNSIIGQKGCIRTTSDYGYKTIDDDVWIYTGVTSVTGDASNVGFVMINQRTSEARYYKISGAEEYSAMASAEGEVQEKNYKASFPSLINVDGTPTYIMVLTDNGGLVKMYAMVNVEQYNLVVTAESQDEIFTKYKKMIAKYGATGGSAEKEEEDTIQRKEVVVKDIQFVTTEGETYVYIMDKIGNVYKQRFAEDESLIKISTGDTVSIEYEIKENGIHRIIFADIVKKEDVLEKISKEEEANQEEKDKKVQSETESNDEQKDTQEDGSI